MSHAIPTSLRDLTGMHSVRFAEFINQCIYESTLNVAGLLGSQFFDVRERVFYHV